MRMWRTECRQSPKVLARGLAAATAATANSSGPKGGGGEEECWECPACGFYNLLDQSECTYCDHEPVDQHVEFHTAVDAADDDSDLEHVPLEHTPKTNKRVESLCELMCIFIDALLLMLAFGA